MSSNTTLNTGGNPPGLGLDLTNPATVLPLVAVLTVSLLILSGGCIIYHRRQKKTTQDLVRKLKVTERRIDAMGMKRTSKKEQHVNLHVDDKKTDYCPPIAVTGSSSSPSRNNLNFTSPDQLELNPSTNVCEEEKKTFTVTVQLNDNSHYDNDSLETKIDTSTNDTSYYFPTYKVEETVSETGFDYTEGTETDLFDCNSSLAAECATIPAVSSLSTVCSTSKVTQPSKVCNKTKKTKSNLHKKTLTDQLSKRSVRFIRGFKLGNGNSTRSPDCKQISLPKELCIAIEAQKTNRLLCQATPIGSTAKQKNVLFATSESLVVKESRDEPISSNKTSPVAQSVTDSCTTNIKRKKEKWV